MQCDECGQHYCHKHDDKHMCQRQNVEMDNGMLIPSITVSEPTIEKAQPALYWERWEAQVAREGDSWMEERQMKVDDSIEKSIGKKQKEKANPKGKFKIMEDESKWVWCMELKKKRHEAVRIVLNSICSNKDTRIEEIEGLIRKGVITLKTYMDELTGKPIWNNEEREYEYRMGCQGREVVENIMIMDLDPKNGDQGIASPHLIGAGPTIRAGENVWFDTGKSKGKGKTEKDGIKGGNIGNKGHEDKGGKGKEAKGKGKSKGKQDGKGKDNARAKWEELELIQEDWEGPLADGKSASVQIITEEDLAPEVKDFAWQTSTPSQQQNIWPERPQRTHRPER